VDAVVGFLCVFLMAAFTITQKSVALGGGVKVGFGRIVASCHHSSTLFQIC
jgi:hypothetical protein